MQLLTATHAELSGPYQATLKLLEDQGIQGVQRNATDCPVHNFIAIHIGYRPEVEISVCSESIRFATTTPDCEARISICDTGLSRLIRDFDGGLLPQLILPGSEPPPEELPFDDPLDALVAELEASLLLASTDEPAIEPQPELALA